ncbi:conserved hypothetical protein [Burkholderia cenocepacia]|nr:conserved hypothetical protein [Burkholderia cenocepacia]
MIFMSRIESIDSDFKINSINHFIDLFTFTASTFNQTG